MTTIAFKDGVLAADRLVTDSGARYGLVTKIGAALAPDGTSVLFASCGAESIGQRWRRWAATGFAVGEDPPAMAVEGHQATGLIIHEDGRALTFDPEQPPFWTEPLRVGVLPLHGFGSGGPFALGAMTMAASAVDAVLVACRFDTRSGGGVDVVSFRDPFVRRATSYP